MAGRRSIRRQGIVLDRTKLGEQDLILTCLAREGDQVRVVAKGARKPGGRLAARTELFCEVDVLLSLGRGLGIVSEAQLVNAHEGVRSDLEALSCASAIAEVAHLTSYEDVPDRFLFPVLNRALDACEQATDRSHLDLVYAAYVFKVLSHGGWRPVLDSCVACGEASFGWFSVHAGGVLCQSCAHETEGAEPADERMIGWISALVGRTFDDLLEAPVDGLTSSSLVAIAHDWAATHLDVRLRASEFFAGM